MSARPELKARMSYAFSKKRTVRGKKNKPVQSKTLLTKVSLETPKDRYYRLKAERLAAQDEKSQASQMSRICNKLESINQKLDKMTQVLPNFCSNCGVKLKTTEGSPISDHFCHSQLESKSSDNLPDWGDSDEDIAVCWICEGVLQGDAIDDPDVDHNNQTHYKCQKMEDEEPESCWICRGMLQGESTADDGSGITHNGMSHYKCQKMEDAESFGMLTNMSLNYLEYGRPFSDIPRASSENDEPLEIVGFCSHCKAILKAAVPDHDGQIHHNCCV